MSRIILVIEFVLGAISVSLYFLDKSIFSLLTLSPFLLILLVPIFSVLSIWPIKDIYNAIEDAIVNDSLSKTNKVSKQILIFAEKSAFTGGILGVIIGLFIVLHNINEISQIDIKKIIINSLISTAFVLLVAIIIKIFSTMIQNRNKVSLDSQLNTDEVKKYNFTKREIEIIQMLSRGFSNREISCMISISEDTVKNHIYNIFNKTDIRSRSGLVAKLFNKSDKKI